MPVLFVLILLTLILVLIVIVLVRTMLFHPPMGNAALKPLDTGPVPDDVLARLTKAISIPTICTQAYTGTDFTPFENFIAFLKDSYPTFHKICTFERVNSYALLYCWKGANPALKPILLIAHYDVVPVEKGTENDWKYPPFSGMLADGCVWGRGTIDIKSQLTAHLEAAESLMRQGFKPERDIYFVYGQDEEIGGRNGAYKTSDYFAEKGIFFDGVLDEGGFVVTGVMKGVASPLALIGIAEKGFCNYEIMFNGSGGHSSMPPTHTALGKAAQFITTVENNPLPPRLSPPVKMMLSNISGEMGFVVRMAMANLWLFRPLLFRILSRSSITNALIRTTFAATMARASDAGNVLPQKASIVINVRHLSGDSVDSVADYFTKLAGTNAISVQKLVPEEPSALSLTDGVFYEKLVSLIKRFYPGAIATPYLMMGGTDARKYYKVCKNVYRFTPIIVSDAEKNTAHNTNEYISVENYGRMIQFFKEFIEGYEK
jgi:carboxypeptidase PM20D1